MKRFLIFGALFPPLALVIFSAPDVVMRHDFRSLHFVYFGMAYTVAIIPALLLARIDQAVRNVVWTTVAGAALTYLAMSSIGFAFLDLGSFLMIGLLGAFPAAVCSLVAAKA